MRTFRDGTGREWCLDVHYGVIERIHEMTGVHILALCDGGFGGLGELLNDYLRLVPVLYAVCSTEAEEKGISREEFCKRLRAEQIEAAAIQLVEELSDFFTDPRRSALRKIADLMRQVIERGRTEGKAIIDAIDLDLPRPANGSTATSGTLPASSASTPDLSPTISSG